MNPNELKHGRRYQIARAVKNPRLDKRERYNPGLLAWTVGDRFRYDLSPRAIECAAMTPGTETLASALLRKEPKAFGQFAELCRARGQKYTDVCRIVVDVFTDAHREPPFVSEIDDLLLQADELEARSARKPPPQPPPQAPIALHKPSQEPVLPLDTRTLLD